MSFGFSDITFEEWAEEAKNIDELFYGTLEERWDFVQALDKEYGCYANVPWVRWTEAGAAERANLLAQTFIVQARDNKYVTVKEVVASLEKPR